MGKIQLALDMDALVLCYPGCEVHISTLWLVHFLGVVVFVWAEEKRSLAAVSNCSGGLWWQSGGLFMSSLLSRVYRGFKSTVGKRVGELMPPPGLAGVMAWFWSPCEVSNRVIHSSHFRLLFGYFLFYFLVTFQKWNLKMTWKWRWKGAFLKNGPIPPILQRASFLSSLFVVLSNSTLTPNPLHHH